PIPQLQLNVNAGLSLGEYGSVGLAYTRVERANAAFARLSGNPSPQPSLPGAFLNQPNQRAQIVSGSYSVQFEDVFFYANAFHDFADRGSNGVSIGITIPLGSRTTTSASVESQAGTQSYQAEVSQSATIVGDWGYRVFGALDHPDHEFAQVTYKSPVALVAAGVDRFGNQTTVQAEAHGAVSFVDGG